MLAIIYFSEYFYTNQVNANMCRSLYESYVSEHSQSFPMEIGGSMTDEEKNQMVIFLVILYCFDYHILFLFNFICRYGNT